MAPLGAKCLSQDGKRIGFQLHHTPLLMERTKNLEAAEPQIACKAEEILFLTFLIIRIASLRDKRADRQHVPVRDN
jgi:hypothetical protein